MKFSAAALFLFAGYASAGSPKLTLKLSDGDYGSVKSALNPSLSFAGESDGVEYGGSVDLSSDSLPKSIWGQTKASVSGWNIKTRAEVSNGKYDFGGKNTGAYITVEGDSENTYLWGSGVVSKGDFHAMKFGGKTVMETKKGKFMVAPRVDYGVTNDDKIGITDHAICYGFEKEDTQAYYTVEPSGANLLVKQKFNDANSGTVKADKNDGFVAATWTNQNDLGSTTLTLTKNDVDIQISNDGWVMGVKTSRKLDSSKVRFSKALTFGV
mmetsp:Transcript_11619/g.33444  ORF Transcript_11619/g.33444 Transcript_11619/m.33444 type:complete len:268 (+) Transcript_11619:109-912(+)|eukprot:CAMPEP_0172373354 /NCGR_PEP_ID=MMETSP1060-20121228/51258_1 /TAXON_ID=37318 /ORGANISM="Pseudo-nitzschia pungens, Strain cf. cingulata" /LENGTH=267 /DNA_ID=CAMNT_0013099665 /DNA_START=97 /DNA_END=900 /DNA_ORIENTATION=+